MTKLIFALLMGFTATAAAQQHPGTPPPSEARQACVKAMNEDPKFAQEIVATADKGIDQRTIDAHNLASAQIAENERHVVYAYAAMWVLAALFVGFLWYRQQMLKAELAALRRELDAAAKDSK